MSLPVKVCGITRLEDARAALNCGAQALGFVFYGPSPRVVAPEKAAAIIRQLPPFVITVGVFVGASAAEINRIGRTCRFDRVQLHGGEPAEMMDELERPAYRAFRLKEQGDLALVEAAPDRTVLLDTFDPGLFGGTGRAFNWEWARALGGARQVILAGGLTPDNVERALQTARPAAVDVSSGVEAEPGIKDHAKMAAFFQAAAAGRAFSHPSPWSGDHARAD